jgi:hypothetical protein
MTARRFNRDAWRTAFMLHQVRRSGALLLAGLGVGWLGANAIAGHWQALVAAGALAVGVGAVVGRKAPRPSEYFEDVHLSREPEGVDEELEAAWKAGGHNSGYLTESGILRVPPSVREALHPPCLVLFAPLSEGRFIFCADFDLDEADGDDVDELLDEDDDVTEETSDPPGPALLADGTFCPDAHAHNERLAAQSRVTK